jgi:RimJ/RimL family protein N-acetyltransferase
MLKIHIATFQDINLLQQLAREIWFAHYTSILSVDQIEYMLQWMYSSNTIEEEMHKGVTWEIATLDSVPVGFIAFVITGDDINLKKLYFKPEVHGKGFGQIALAHVIEYALTHQIPKVVLSVNKNNHKAIRAYEKAGFTCTGSKVDDIGNGYVMDDFVYTFIVVRG